MLATMTITAKQVTAESLPAAYAGEQVATGARLGALGNRDLMDTPFNVTSYTASLIEDQQAKTLADVVMNDPSVRFTTSSGHAYENFRIRGFDVNAGDVALNGMFGLAPVGHVPVEFIERVEVLKGPSALFSGMAPGGGVGGMINVALKRAADTDLTRASVGYQSDSQLGTSVDLGRRYGENNAWGTRLNGAYSDGDTTLDGQSKTRKFVAIAQDYRRGALTASLDAYHSDESFDGGTPAMYWFASDDIPAVPSPETNQFSNGYGELKSKAVIARAEYVFNSNISAFAGAGMMDHDYSGFIHGSHARQIQPNGDYNGLMVGQLGYSDNISAEVGVRANFQTGSIGHELVLHATHFNREDGSDVTRNSFTSNIYNPIKADMPALPTHAPKTAEATLDSQALIDTLSLFDEQLLLTFGVRKQQVENNSFAANGNQTAHYDESAITPAFALVVKPWGPDISLYANYIQGLSRGDTVTDTNATNYQQVFKPYKTEQRELGGKWNAGQYSHSLSLFEIVKPTLVALGDSSAPTYSDDGEKQIRGVEWNTFGALTPDVRLLGGLTYTQGELTKTAYDINNGNVAVGAPRWQGTLGSEWDLPWVEQLTLSGRMLFTSSQYINAANTQKVAGWSQFDVGARYGLPLNGRDLELRLNVNNLFDRHYWSGSFSDSTPIATIGAPRTVMASATMTF